MPGFRWKKGEIDFIRNNINSLSDKDFSLQLNKSVCGIKQKRRKLRILRRAEKCIYYLTIEERPMCACGCGNKTSGRYDTNRKTYPLYINGHQNRNEKFRTDTASKISKTLMGKRLKPRFCINCNVKISEKTTGYRIKYCKECKKRIMSDFMKKKGKEIMSDEKLREKSSERMKINNPMKNPETSKKSHQEYKRKIKEGILKPSFLGKKHNLESKQKIRDFRINAYKNGLIHPMLGKHHKKESCDIIGKKAKERLKDKTRHPNWLGGLSFKPYGLEFNRELRAFVRFRDNFICQICLKSQEELKRKLCVHHIDYDKKNNSPFNLISLCLKCHIKTNTNRKYWKEYFISDNLQLKVPLQI